MCTFWVKTAHLAYYMFSLYYGLLYFSYFPLWFLRRDFGSDCKIVPAIAYPFFCIQILYLGFRISLPKNIYKKSFG